MAMEKKLTNKTTEVSLLHFFYAEMNPIAENLKGEDRTGHRMNRAADKKLTE